MPSSSPDVQVFNSASEIPGIVWDCFRKDPRGSNIIFPHAEYIRQQEVQGRRRRGADIYIVCASPSSDGRARVDLVLACTEGPLDAYPIFIYTPMKSHQLHAGYIAPRMFALVNALRVAVPAERVYSVFALDNLSKMFATMWSQQTGVRLDRDSEYYAAKLTYCTRSSFKPQPPAALPGNVTYDLRPGRESDIPLVAKLCEGFASESEPFVLNPDGAIKEAKVLIQKGQLWVHEIKAPGQRVEIASIVATTRVCDAVAAITKVYTNPRWRQRGCAERLTRRVCEFFLETKESVVLYVAHNNPAAAKVYHRVGFVGLADNSCPLEGVEPWLELGFDREVVRLGHW